MIQLKEVDAGEYARQLKPYHVFGAPSFAELNAAKVSSVCFLLFADSRTRLGIIGGLQDGVFSSPFSAPFDGFTPMDPDVAISTIDDSALALEQWAKLRNIHTVRITPPPPLYAESFLAKVTNVFFRRGYTIRNTELNFHFELSRMTDEYASTIWRNARKNLRQALENNLNFFRCQTEEEKVQAYEVIRKNREARMKPLRMSFDQLKNTGNLVTIDFFLVRDAQQVNVGAAIVFHVADQIGQVVYWGDLPQFAHLRTMNFLSYNVFKHYQSAGFRVLDIGYSTENSVPNHGLCEFKESLGCSIQPKLIYEKIVS